MSSWFGFGAPKSNLPSVTPLQAQRSKQIESLKNVNPNVVELKRDEEYRVTFTCGGNHVAFAIYLPPEFPQAKPIITVSPPMRHGFLDDSMKVVRYLPLVNFSVQTDLGRMIHTLIQDFSKQPMLIQPDVPQQRPMPPVPQYQHFIPQPSTSPQQLPPLQQSVGPQGPFQPAPPHSHHTPQHIQMPTPHSGSSGFPVPGQFPSQTQALPQQPVPSFPSATSIPSSSTTTMASQALSSPTPSAVNGSMLESVLPIVEPNIPVPGMSSIRGLQNGHAYSMPLIPPSFDDVLKDLSQDQLEALLSDEEELDAIFQKLPQIQRMLAERAQLYRSCEEIAEINLSYQPRVEALQRDLEERVRTRTELKNKFDMNCLQQQRLNEQCSLHHLLDNMRVSAADAEHLSDDLAERFTDDKINLEEFLKQFSEQRRLLHMRRVKEEKLGQLLSQQVNPSPGRF
ncbi:vacuolar protein sorting-associated protein 37A-like [Diadema antillarum]|uniref:vacuolar protein sorting-associated protein 37A-like n=1 Tax=Diadema antillarum TaxID=105358 RepID=UPI003A85F152